MSVQTKVKSFLNYITGSAGGWPTNTNVAIIGGMDYVEETGSKIYILMNEYQLRYCMVLTQCKQALF